MAAIVTTILAGCLQEERVYPASIDISGELSAPAHYVNVTQGDLSNLSLLRRLIEFFDSRGGGGSIENDYADSLSLIHLLQQRSPDPWLSSEIVKIRYGDRFFTIEAYPEIHHKGDA